MKTRPGTDSMESCKSEESVKTPVFSIGVPTYNRKDLLKQALSSLLAQTFTDFEIIIGNDYPNETLSTDILGIHDPRVRIVNHPRNLGELENMNHLLGMANGRYFTWQFDDDLCSPNLLKDVYSTLLKYDFPKAVFTSFLYIYGTSFHKFQDGKNGQERLLSGREFLKKYLSGSLKALGCCGFYETDYLKSGGGVQRLTNGLMALHSEYLLLFNAGLLPEIAYIDNPLVSYRVHRNSWTISNDELELFKQAGINLIRKSIEIFSTTELKEDFQNNLTSILKLILGSVIGKNMQQNRKLDLPEIEKYVSAMTSEFHPLVGSPLYYSAVESLNAARKNIPRFILKARLNMVLPAPLFRYAHRIRIFLSRIPTSRSG